MDNSLRREELYLKERIWAQPSDEEMPRNQRSWWGVAWWIVALDWWSSNHWWRVEMWFHRMKKEMHRFRSPVRFYSNARDVSRDPPIAIDLNRYNSRSMVQMISVKIQLTHVCDHRLDGPRVPCIYTRLSSRSPSDAPHRATRLANKEIEGT